MPLLAAANSDLVITLGASYLVATALAILFAVLALRFKDLGSTICAGVLTGTAAIMVFFPDYSGQAIGFSWIVGGTWLLVSVQHNRGRQDMIVSELNIVKSQVYELRSKLVLTDISFAELRAANSPSLVGKL